MLTDEQELYFGCDVAETLYRQNSIYEKSCKIKKLILQHEVQSIDAIRIIFRLTLDSPFIRDDEKEYLINRVALQYRELVSNSDFIRIVQTDGKTGIDNSLMRDAIRNDLPLAFRALYYAAGACEAFFPEYANSFHRPSEIIKIMREKNKFNLKTENGYGPSGKLSKEAIERGDACCWVVAIMERIYLEEPIKPKKPSEKLMAFKKELYNIMPLSNVPAVLQKGILSHNLAANIPHQDVSNTGIQERRAKITLPNGKTLHEYANLYFDARNPMMSRLSHTVPDNSFCVLRISPEVLDLPGIMVSDRNAAANDPCFLPADRLSVLDKEAIYADSWDRVSGYNKAAKCAEVLVPNSVEPRYIIGAYVANLQSKNFLMEIGVDESRILMNSELFFKTRKPVNCGTKRQLFDDSRTSNKKVKYQ